jgi:hypothetical protein
MYYIPQLVHLLCFSSFYLSPFLMVSNLGLTLARQALYPLSHSASPLVIFSNRIFKCFLSLSSAEGVTCTI